MPSSPTLEVETPDFATHLAINTTSAFVAAREAARAFEALPEAAARTFIYTGNIAHEWPLAAMLTLSVGKAAMANVVAAAVEGYKRRGFK